MSIIEFTLQENQNIRSDHNILEIYNSNQKVVKEITPEMDSKTMAQIVSDRLLEIVLQELKISSSY